MRTCAKQKFFVSFFCFIFDTINVLGSIVDQSTVTYTLGFAFVFTFIRFSFFFCVCILDLYFALTVAIASHRLWVRNTKEHTQAAERVCRNKRCTFVSYRLTYSKAACLGRNERPSPVDITVSVRS